MSFASLEFALRRFGRFRHVGDTCTETDLASVQVLRNERDLGRAIRARAHLPDGRLECVARLDGRREAHAEVLECVRLVAPDRGEDRTGSEAKRREAMEDDATEARRLAYLWVCAIVALRVSRADHNEAGVRTDMQAVVVTAETVDHRLLR